MFSPPILTVEHLPSFAQATVTEKANMKLVHLLLYVPELRGASQVIENPITAIDVQISLRTDGKPVNRAYLAPSGQSLEIQQKGGCATVRVPTVTGYQLVVFEL